MRLPFRICAIIFGFALSIPTAFADSIVNGDFSAGNVGFTSDYTYVSSISGACAPLATYTVGTNPQGCKPGLTASFGDHTTGTGNMMIASGATAPNPLDLKVWEESSVSVGRNTLYLFSAWVNIIPPNDPPPVLQFTITGLQDGSTSSVTFDAPRLAPQVWESIGGAWYSGANTTADVFITDSIGSSGGNDFALDDISLRPIPEPTSLLLYGTGITGYLSRRFLKRRADRVSDPSV